MLPVVGLVSLQVCAAVVLCSIAHGVLLSVSVEVSPFDLCPLSLSLSVPGVFDADALRGLLGSVCALIECVFYEFLPVCVVLCVCLIVLRVCLHFVCVWCYHSS